MKVERTRDLSLVERIITDPAIYPHVSDDGAPSPEAFEAVEHPNLYYLLVTDPEPEGVFVYHGHNCITAEVHTCLLPSCRGDRATIAARASLAWIFDHTPYRKVITKVPVMNRLAYRFAKRVGMVDEGTDRASFLKGGQVHDQHLLGITKEELTCL